MIFGAAPLWHLNLRRPAGLERQAVWKAIKKVAKSRIARELAILFLTFTVEKLDVLPSRKR